MKSTKTSTSISKATEPSVAAKSEPVKRTTKSSTAVKPSTTKATSHKHSKLTAQSVPSAPVKQFDHDTIARLAHSFWVERNFDHGFAEEDWHRAIKVLSASSSSS